MIKRISTCKESIYNVVGLPDPSSTIIGLDYLFLNSDMDWVDGAEYTVIHPSVNAKESETRPSHLRSV